MAKKRNVKVNPTNLTALKNIWEQLGNISSNGSAGAKWLPWLKMKVGDKINLRFLPLSFNNDIPFIAVKEHRGLFPTNHLRATCCPKSVGMAECPICDYAFSNYMEAKEKGDTDTMNAMKNIMPKNRVYAVIWNRTTKRVEKMGLSWKLFSEVMTEWDDDERDVTDPYEGYDFKLKLVPQADGKKSYTISMLETSLPLSDDDTEIEEVLTTVEEHREEILKFKEPLNSDELRSLLKVNADSGGSEDEAEEDEDNISSQVSSLLERAEKNKERNTVKF